MTTSTPAILDAVLSCNMVAANHNFYRFSSGRIFLYRLISLSWFIILYLLLVNLCPVWQAITFTSCSCIIGLLLLSFCLICTPSLFMSHYIGWASRTFYSDNGSTAIEIALKMAFRKFLVNNEMHVNSGKGISSERCIELRVGSIVFSTYCLFIASVYM